MKKIAYYISDYGYGHAARSIAIIRELIKRQPSVEIIICHSFATDFLEESLPYEQVFIRNVSTDIGYFLKEQSIEPDTRRLEKEFDRFMNNWEGKIEREYCFLLENEVDLVISDISPLPFEAAAKADIPSVGISNFTWSTAYEYLLDKSRLKSWNQAYEKMTYFYLLAGNNEIDWSCEMKEFSFFAREVQNKKVEEVLNQVNPSRDKRVIFFGLGMKINHVNVNSLPIWDSKDCVFIVSSNVRIDRKNVFSIPIDETESQHYIAASDLVLTKAGWGTVSEAVINNVPLLIVDRDGMKEDKNTIDFIIKNGLGETIDWEDLLSYQYDKDKSEKEQTNNFKNEVTLIVEELLRV